MSLDKQDREWYRKNRHKEITELRAIGDMAGIENPFELNDLLEELKQQEAFLKKQDTETKRLDEQYAKITDSVQKMSENLSVIKEQAGGIVQQISEAEQAHASTFLKTRKLQTSTLLTSTKNCWN